jgi:predicted ATPase
VTRLIGVGLFGLAVVLCVMALVQGELALRDAKTANRLGRVAGWFTLVLEPRAFTGKASARRQRAVTAALLFVLLTLGGAVLARFAL